jgi:hypothetical protein
MGFSRVGCAGFAYIFVSLQSEKNPYFYLSFALSEYERRTLLKREDKEFLMDSTGRKIEQAN